MTKLSKKQIKTKITEYEEKYQNEIKTYGCITKNAVFYASTINLYRKDLGLKPIQRW